MANNRISAALSDADKTAAITSLDAVKSKLPFLVNLTDEERTNERKMGPKSVQYVNLNLQGAKNFPETIPSGVDVNEFAKDVNLINQLWELRIKVSALLEGIDDTMMAAGIDAIKTADSVYGYLKASSKNNSNVKALLDEIGKRFEGQGKKKTVNKS